MQENISALLIDDEKSVRATLAAFLEQVGVKVEIRDSTQLGVERIREVYSGQGRYDLILTDLNQHPTGVEVVQAIRGYDQETLCYMITGGASPKLLLQAKQLAAEDKNTGFLDKPFGKTELHAIVEKAREHQIYQRPT